MKILIIGNGGREHALAWKVRQSPQVTEVFVAPGNAGTALEPGVNNVAIAADNVAQLLAFAQSQGIDLTIVGPEAPLAVGVVDTFTANGLRCFGPTQAAARLESSKAFSKDFMQQYRIPTARYATFTDLNQALNYVTQHPVPLVIKADGLAAGKGVVIAQTQAQAQETLHDMLGGNRFGSAGHRVVIEEFIQGEEASFIVLADGKHALALATSQDHKARDDGDQGPNTGGMGAYSPAPIVTPAMQEKVMQEVIYPTLQGLAEQGCPYTGFLYAGLMITPAGDIRVLEFNCRLGDPETQPIMMRLQSDLVEACLAGLEQRLDKLQLQWDPRPALGVVMAAKGYPDAYPKGDVITGLPTADDPNCKVFHAGTVLEEGQIRTAGGRILCVTALGESVHQAQQRAYATVRTIHWAHTYYRTDIGHRAIHEHLTVSN